MTVFAVTARHTLRDGLRAPALLVIVVLTAAIGVLYGLAAAAAFHDAPRISQIDDPELARAVTAATLLAIGMFVVLFLGATLAAFLTVGAVRGDAAQGLLQPIVARPVGRPAYLLARLSAPAALSAAYTFAAYAGAVLLTGLLGHWWPSQFVGPGLELAGAVVVIAAFSVLGSVAFKSVANGIATFMLFAAGVFAGSLGQMAKALSSQQLDDMSRIASWILPFQGLYQRGLAGIVPDVPGIPHIVLDVGALSAARPSSAWLLVCAAAWVIGALAAATLLFTRLDL